MGILEIRFSKWVFAFCEMGNVNGREDGGGSPSAVGVEEEGGGDGGGGSHGANQNMASRHESHASYHPSGGSHELMGQSPPHSPRATQSPLMFAPQVNSLKFLCFLSSVIPISFF